MWKGEDVRTALVDRALSGRVEANVRFGFRNRNALITCIVTSMWSLWCLGPRYISRRYHETSFIFPTHSSMVTDADALKSQLDHLRLEVHSLKAKAGTENISIGNYLLTRLAQLHVTVRIIIQLLLPLVLCSIILHFRQCSVCLVISTWDFWYIA